MKQIIQQLVAEKKLRYTTYPGNGDRISYEDVVVLDPYPSIVVDKHETAKYLRKHMQLIATISWHFVGVELISVSHELHL